MSLEVMNQTLSPGLLEDLNASYASKSAFSSRTSEREALHTLNTIRLVCYNTCLRFGLR